MKFIPRMLEVEAVPVELSGAALMVVEADGKAHCVPADAFWLLFEAGTAVYPAPVPACGRTLAVAPIDTEAIKRGPRKQRNHAAELATSPVRRRIARESSCIDLTGYPARLHNPLASTRRGIWDGLTTPATLDEICSRTGLGSAAAFAALSEMRKDQLVHKRDADGKWERTTETQ